MDNTTYNALAVAVGIASHILYFNRVETHMHGVSYLLTFLIWSVSLPIALVQYGSSVVLACCITTSINTSFLIGAFGSTLVYRLLLNPLNKFPGPWQARISSLWWSSQLGKSDAYLKLQALHQKYGKYVRIGSNDLSVIDPAAMEMSFGANSKVTKASWYDTDSPLNSMHTTRDKQLHDRRRKVWAPAFSDKALRGYEELVQPFNDKLISRLTERQGQPVNVTSWFNLYSFDVMGSLAFGKQYGMLDSGVKTKELELLNEGMEPMAQMIPSWLIRILISIPNLMPGYEKFVQFCKDELSWRVSNEATRQDGEKAAKRPQAGSDIMTWILQAYREIKEPAKEPLLQADARLIIVAGSDTTAATLTCMFYHLAKNPQVVQQIRAELLPLCQGNWVDSNIKNAKYLNGAINEALRLHPPVPSGLRRLAPREGLVIGETILPGGTEFFFPQYVMGRDNDIYPQAEAFMPERWFSKTEMIKHKDAFAPFSVGPFGCIGKNLALMELRTLTAQIVLRFDMSLAPGEDGNRLLTKTKDHFTVALGDLDLVFTPTKA